MSRTPPNLFRSVAASKVSRVLRTLLERGEMLRSEFKAEHVALGGTKLNTHAFDRYIVGSTNGRHGTYVPSKGSYNLIERIGNPRSKKCRYKWVGSEGSTFEERATNWLDRLKRNGSYVALDAITRELTADPSNEITRTWYRLAAASYSRVTRRDIEGMTDVAKRLSQWSREGIEQMLVCSEYEVLEDRGDVETPLVLRWHRMVADACGAPVAVPAASIGRVGDVVADHQKNRGTRQNQGGQASPPRDANEVSTASAR